MRDNTSAHGAGDYRSGVGIMLLNDRGEVLVARRNDVPGEAWQMPQGGIEDGEEPAAAAMRELREEIGTDQARVLAESEGWLQYDVPADVRDNARHRTWRGQRQKWFVMRFTGEDRDINLISAHAEFDAWKWAPVRDLPKLVVSFKQQVYVDLLAEFPDIARGLNKWAEFMADPIVRLTMAADSVSENELYDLLERTAANVRQRADEELDRVGAQSSEANTGIPIKAMTHPLDRLYEGLLTHGHDGERHPRTAQLLSGGPRRMAQKLGEEAVAVALETVAGHRDGIIRESSDLLYQLLVIWAATKISAAEVWEEMQRRENTMCLAEKLPKPA
jgi:putative (di)nucleoside polyphosphate hydrolase